MSLNTVNFQARKCMIHEAKKKYATMGLLSKHEPNKVLSMTFSLKLQKYKFIRMMKTQYDTPICAPHWSWMRCTAR